MPKALDKETFTKEMTRLEAEVKKRKDLDAQKKQDFTIGDIVGNQHKAADQQKDGETLRELNLPGGKTSAAAA